MSDTIHLENKLKLEANHISYLKREIGMTKMSLKELETKMIGAERRVQQLEIEIRECKDKK